MWAFCCAVFDDSALRGISDARAGFAIKLLVILGASDATRVLVGSLLGTRS
jgi:hypothetical protein